MTATLQLSGDPVEQLRATTLAPYAGLYARHLSDYGYAPSTQGDYLRGLVHFGRWISQCGLKGGTLAKRSSRGFSTSTYPIAGVRLRSYARAQRFRSRSAIFWWSCGPMP